MEIKPAQNPIALFQDWLAEASRTEPNDPNAMALATVDAQGRPAVRMVLLKSVSDEGFTFFTNMESRKGQELFANPHAALCFHWKSCQRQVRVEGKVDTVGDAAADAYFKTRHPLSRLGAWASRQSQPLESRQALEARVEEYKKKFEGGETPRPSYWSGFRLTPQRIEFWQEGNARLHDRFLFERTGENWTLRRLNP